jgi:hypothetical protein
MASTAFVLTQFRNIHYYYNQRSEEFKRAEIYLKSDVCSNGELAALLGSFAQCEEAKRITDIYPFTRAWYDFLEDMYVCGHGRCDVFWSEVSVKLPYIMFFMGCVLLWLAWQTVQVQRMSNASMYYRLPMMSPQLEMKHLHRE